MDPTQPPTQESVQSPPEIIVPQPKSNYLKTIIFLILGILLVVSIMYLYIQNQQLKKQAVNIQVIPTAQVLFPTLQSASPIPRLVSSISIPPDETEDWKTYTNEVCKYTVKFPVDWKKTSDPFVGEESINFSPLSTEVFSSSDRSINILATSLNERPINNLQDEIDNYNSFLWKNWTNKKIQNINFENLNAILVTGESYGVAHIVILLKTNNCYFVLEGVGDYIQTFNQILSTFKFVN